MPFPGNYLTGGNVMKKRILAMLLSVVMLASTVELTSLLTGTNILAGTEAPAVTDTAPTSDTDTASGGQRITDEDTAAIRLSGSELSVSGDIEPDAAQPSSGGTATLDENNALTIPYDLAFPEEFASADCLYAGDQIMVKFARGFRGKLNTTLVRAGITGLEKLMDTSTGVWYIASVTVTVVQPAESIAFAESVYVTTLEQTDDDLKLTITPAAATERDIAWESSNPEICEMGTDGQLIKHKNGTATLRATLVGADLSAELVVCISDEAPSARVEDIQRSGGVYYARLSDGTLWCWGSSYMTPQKLNFADVDDFAVDDSDYIYILSGGTLQWYMINGTVYSNSFNYGKPMTGVRKITGAQQVWNFSDTTYIQTADGFYGTGRNDNRALANLTTENSAVPVRIFFGLQANEEPFHLEQTNITNDILADSALVLDFSESLLKADNFGAITLKDGSGELVSLRRTLHLDKLTLTPVSGFTDGMSYTLTLPAGALQTKFGAASEAVELTFTYQAPAPVEEDSLTLGKTVLTGVLSPESGTKVDLGEIKEAFKLEFKCVSNPDASITWTVADNAVAMVENGNLIALSTGCTTVTAALDGTDLAATALLYISEDDSVTAIKSVQNGDESTVLFSNGALFTLHADGATQQLFADAVDFHWDGGALWVKTASALYCDGELTEDLPISVKYTNLLSRTSDTVLVGSQTLILTADKTLCQGENFSNIAISGGSASSATSGNQLLITPLRPPRFRHFLHRNDSRKFRFHLLRRAQRGDHFYLYLSGYPGR